MPHPTCVLALEGEVHKMLNTACMTDKSSEQTLSFNLLAFAGDVIVPVHERAVGVVPPSPDVQLKNRTDPVAVRAADEQKGLSFEHWRSVVVICEPSSSVHDELDAYQPQLSVRRLVDQGFWLRGIDQTIAHQSTVDVMNAHGAVVRTANAAKERPVACRRSCIDIKELPRCVPNCLNQLGRDGGVLVLRWTSLDERRGEDQAGSERQGQNAFRQTVKQRCKFCFHFLSPLD